MSPIQAGAPLQAAGQKLPALRTAFGLGMNHQMGKELKFAELSLPNSRGGAGSSSLSGLFLQCSSSNFRAEFSLVEFGWRGSILNRKRGGHARDVAMRDGRASQNWSRSDRPLTGAINHSFAKANEHVDPARQFVQLPRDVGRKRCEWQ